MLMWNTDKLKIMATADVDIVLDLSEFGFSSLSNIKINGFYDKLVKKNGIIKLKLLEGKPVIFLSGQKTDETEKI
jgi:hypothetical protein